MSWLDRLPGERRGHVAVRWIVLRLLGLVYFAAFWSIWTQVDGLFGSQGINPAAELVRAAHEQLGPDGWQRFPTLFWLGCTDADLHHLIQAGMVLSAALTLGLAPGPILVVLFALYHSLLLVGDPFLSFQWDALLLEAGFLAIFYAPWRLVQRPSREAGPPVAFVWLMRWLLFRLMFSSGAVKLTSNDPAWANLTAMSFHYFTQPLPPFTAWFWHQLPPLVHKIETLATFVLELGVPFLIFGHRAARKTAFAGFAMLSAMLLITGNYGFFNWLTLALSVSVTDDDCLPERLRRLIAGPPGAPAPAPLVTRLSRMWVAPLALAIALVTFTHLTRTLELEPPDLLVPLYERILKLDAAVAPVHPFSQYGLFRVMTVERPEVIVEGSNDGIDWRPYEFRYKMGDPQRRPGLVAPHMPRLDWQMWFAALSGSGRQRWFVNFMSRLLRGSPAVLDLLEKSPFPDAPPRFIRATLYDYRFTTPDERKATGAWWHRTEVRNFFPQAQLR